MNGLRNWKNEKRRKEEMYSMEKKIIHKLKDNINLIFAAILLLPTVVLNSAFWGQCDAIYTFFIIVTLVCLYKRKEKEIYASFL